MATPLLVCGYRNDPRNVASHLRCSISRAASLLELIIVLFIISVLAGMLFPALQAARAKADSTACLNNIRQLGFALSQCVSVKNRFPDPNRWTIDILKWMEERPLADEIAAGGLPKGAKYPRPKLFRCHGQAEVPSTVPDIGVCHYVLVVDRPIAFDMKGRASWQINDRPRLSDDELLPPWYIGPEISFAEQAKMFATMQGPHPSGVFYDNGGQTHGGND